MNLSVLYNQQEQERRALLTYKGHEFTPLQAEMYKTLRQAAEQEMGVINPSALSATRRAGKTTVLMKLAEDMGVPIVVRTVERIFNRDEGPEAVTAAGTRQLRGRRIRGVIVDEGVNLDAIDPNIKILTGIHGRYHGNEFEEIREDRARSWNYYH